MPYEHYDDPRGVHKRIQFERLCLGLLVLACMCLYVVAKRLNLVNVIIAVGCPRDIQRQVSLFMQYKQKGIMGLRSDFLVLETDVSSSTAQNCEMWVHTMTSTNFSLKVPPSSFEGDFYCKYHINAGLALKSYLRQLVPTCPQTLRLNQSSKLYALERTPFVNHCSVRTALLG